MSKWVSFKGGLYHAYILILILDIVLVWICFGKLAIVYTKTNPAFLMNFPFFHQFKPGKPKQKFAITD